MLTSLFPGSSRTCGIPRDRPSFVALQRRSPESRLDRYVCFPFKWTGLFVLRRQAFMVAKFSPLIAPLWLHVRYLYLHSPVFCLYLEIALQVRSLYTLKR